MAVAVILISFNQKRLTLACLRSLVDVEHETELEIIVVDNASSDGAADAIAAEFPNVVVIRNRTNRGFARACNQAIAATRAPLILLLNNDTVVHAGAIRAMATFLASREEVGVVGAQLVGEDGHIQPSTHDLPTTRNLLFNAVLNRSVWARQLWGVKSYKYWSFDYVRQVPFVSGASLMVKRSVINVVGPLDEDFPMYSEDLELCMRVTAIGKAIYYLPFAKITHLGGRSSRHLHRRFMYYTSLLILSRKHYTFRSHWLPRAYWGLKRGLLYVVLTAAGYRGLGFIGERLPANRTLRR